MRARVCVCVCVFLYVKGVCVSLMKEVQVGEGVVLVREIWPMKRVVREGLSFCAGRQSLFAGVS